LNKGAYVELNITKVLTTGAATTGKTCTKHYIFGLPPPDQYTSTDVFESMERHYAYYSAIVDPQDPCEWKIATLDTILAMIKSNISKKKGIKFDDKLGFDIQIDLPPTARTSETQVSFKDPGDVPATLADPKVETVHSVNQKRNYTIKKLLDPKVRISGEVLSVHWIHFVDGGGQSEFLELLPALVSNVTVTIYVIDLCRKPDEPCNDFFTINDRPQGTRKTYLTGKELFERFLKTVCSQKDDIRCKVLFVGTHYDSSPEILRNLEEWDQLIRTFWNEYDTDRKVKIIKTTHNRNVHAIDANFRGDGEQIAAKDMRKKLAQCCVQRKVAIAEFLIEEDLKSSLLAQKHHGILTYSECQEITKQYARENTLKKALQYFHELNEYIFFPREGLVFTKPGVLVRIISKFIKVANYCRGDSSSHVNFWKFGLISDKDLNEILEYHLPHEELSTTTYLVYRPRVFEGKELLKVLQNLFIAASCADWSAHFIPCVLPPCSKTDDINKSTLEFMKKNHPLLLTFNRGSIPRGLFCGVVTYLMDTCGWIIRPGNKQNYRTLIEFEIPGRYKVVLVEDFKLIRVHAARTARKSVRLKVRKNIADGVETVGKKFYGTEDDSIICPNASFTCSCSEQLQSHVASVVSHETDAMERRLVCEKSGEDVLFTKDHYDWLHEVEDPRSSSGIILLCFKLCILVMYRICGNFLQFHHLLSLVKILSC
jgi:hypothetical protein